MAVRLVMGSGYERERELLDQYLILPSPFSPGQRDEHHSTISSILVFNNLLTV